MLGFKEDGLFRHIEPSHAFHLDLPRLSNFAIRPANTSQLQVKSNANTTGIWSICATDSSRRLVGFPPNQTKCCRGDAAIIFRLFCLCLFMSCPFPFMPSNPRSPWNVLVWFMRTDQATSFVAVCWTVRGCGQKGWQCSRIVSYRIVSYFKYRSRIYMNVYEDVVQVDSLHTSHELAGKQASTTRRQCATCILLFDHVHRP